jgi:DNA ligase (NAD+)
MYTAVNIHALNELTRKWMLIESLPNAVELAAADIESLRTVLRFHEYQY